MHPRPPHPEPAADSGGTEAGEGAPERLEPTDPMDAQGRNRLQPLLVPVRVRFFDSQAKMGLALEIALRAERRGFAHQSPRCAG